MKKVLLLKITILTADHVENMVAIHAQKAILNV